MQTDLLQNFNNSKFIENERYLPQTTYLKDFYLHDNDSMFFDKNLLLILNWLTLSNQNYFYFSYKSNFLNEISYDSNTFLIDNNTLKTNDKFFNNLIKSNLIINNFNFYKNDFHITTVFNKI